MGFRLALGFRSSSTQMNQLLPVIAGWKMAREEEEGLTYWMRWQVPVCALIAAVPAAAAIAVIWRKERQTMRAVDLWAPCWRKVSPFWLLAYRAVALLVMACILARMVLIRGVLNFYFYTQWTFALVIIYFTIGTLLSAHGCWLYSISRHSQCETSGLLRGDLENCHAATLSHTTNKERDGIILPTYHEGQIPEKLHEERTGLLGHAMQIIYQTSAGAVMLTDVIFWSLLAPLLSNVHYRVNLIMACMHSLNAIFLLVDTALNRLPFPLFGMSYFFLWSCIYVAFQWGLHACGFTRWPYPFMELSTPWAPLWYLVLVLIHIPCFGLFYLIARKKNSFLSKAFPNAYIKLY